MSKLLIVESPSKVKKIAAFLGAGWIVEASRGHVRDLPDAELGIDLQSDFAMQYKVLTDKLGTVSRLKKAIKTADAVYLATDPDREGEAISWHILEMAKAESKGKPIHRVTFTAITQQAVLAAVAAPRNLDLNLIEAQQTRRVVDRLVGYLVSPLACKSMNSRVSAGRVQSVCLRLVVDREREISAFIPSKYWTLAVQLKAADDEFAASLTTVRGQKSETWTPEQIHKLRQGLNGAAFWIEDVKQVEKARRPLPPFTTSSLQQAASKTLGLSPERTMTLAQVLYENGLITYMRTDSTSVAPEGQAAAREYINQQYGEQHVPTLPQIYVAHAENAQEAHEAIRPTAVNQLSATLEPGDGANLYGLIWNRFIASQMTNARYALVLVSVLAGPKQGQPYPIEFRAKGRTLLFGGFLKVYEETLDDGEEIEKDVTLPPLASKEMLTFLAWKPEEHTTKAPSRYTEAALVQALERCGVGRPSTYANMVKTIKEKHYVKLERKQLVPTDIGCILCDLLVKRFPVIFDVEYTASLERDLDQIAGGAATRLAVLQTFWTDKFFASYKSFSSEIAEQLPPPKVPKIIGTCPECGGNLIERHSVKGTFAGCENFPKCKGKAEVMRFSAVGKGKQ